MPDYGYRERDVRYAVFDQTLSARGIDDDATAALLEKIEADVDRKFDKWLNEVRAQALRNAAARMPGKVVLSRSTANAGFITIPDAMAGWLLAEAERISGSQPTDPVTDHTETLED